MFNNGGNSPFTFQAEYQQSFTRIYVEQDGAVTPTGVEFSWEYEKTVRFPTLFINKDTDRPKAWSRGNLAHQRVDGIQDSRPVYIPCDNTSVGPFSRPDQSTDLHATEFEAYVWEGHIQAVSPSV